MNSNKVWRWAEKTNPSNYVLPFGRYKGRTLAQVDRSQRGHQWLLWAMDRLEAPNVVKAIKEFLSQRINSRPQF